MKKINKNIIIIFILLWSSQLFSQNSWRSLIIPGLGEYKLGEYNQSKKFMIAEVSIWLCYFNFGDFSSSYKNDFRNNAIMYAGVNWDNKDDRFAANVGNYNSIYEYNQYQDWAGNFGNHYENENGEYHWDWNNNDEQRNKYDSWRIKSANYKEFQEFAVAALIVNRLISVFNIINLERNNKITSDIIKDGNHSVMLKINYNF